ncbi:DUF2244 domain-containing protein [Reyranella sp.]|jgi:uncharacterized membrane protein|uniref:DUF2244 domain-containing protein n=1 Tax=Reyranella sp. TaxID=1929291 RepID=UPI00263561E5|nr:DUF2244 domain-containing protein [Reyranella sp.]HQS16923.1 DUF2244 domain-containing protein [Reyranella sp.]HQT12592.1 DUF2244 domain-containing protein [Reyranella sp.]
MTEAPLPAVHFATSLKPYRSLSADGFRFVMLAAVAANLVIGLPLFLMGAWPVFGFMGLDVFLLWWLFKRSYFDARRTETLTLTDHDLVVVRIAPDGEREELRLDAYWLKVEASEERLVVTSRGNRAVIGRFLGPDERLRVAEQLKAAIADMRAPRYDHAWDE